MLVFGAQNDGQGGVFALYGLVHDPKGRRARMLLALILAPGRLIGDGTITPAISVFSAVEGMGSRHAGLGRLA